MQAAECASVEDAARIEAELEQLCAAYLAYERAAKNPWSPDAIPEPLVAFGERHGVPWPREQRDARFLLKGTFDDAAELLRVDRMVFFWGGGFDLGGPWLREILVRLGARATTTAPRLVVACADPAARAEELATFLVEEDHEDQFTVSSDDADLDDASFSITLVHGDTRRHLLFDDSGVQDWAFVALLPQLDGEDPSLAAEG